MTALIRHFNIFLIDLFLACPTLKPQSRCVEKVEAYRTNPLQFLKSFHSTNFVLDIKLFERTFWQEDQSYNW